MTHMKEGGSISIPLGGSLQSNITYLSECKKNKKKVWGAVLCRKII